MKRMLLAVAILSASAYPLMTAYKVEPVKASWSGMADPRPDYGISQTITCNWDHLDSATGGYVELFAGDHGAGGAYNLEIEDITAGQVVAKEENRTPGGSHTWLKFSNIQMEPGRSFTKGKQYEFKFTRSGSDSIQYYYSEGSPYGYGNLLNPTGPPHPVDLDLAARVYGVMDAVDSTHWGFNIQWPGETQHRNLVAGLAKGAGVGFDRMEFTWDWCEPSAGDFNFDLLDKHYHWRHDTIGCQTLGLLSYSTVWSGSTLDSVTPGGDTLWHTGSPPRNLFLPVWDSSNYWARYVEAVVRHYGGDVNTETRDTSHIIS